MMQDTEEDKYYESSDEGSSSEEEDVDSDDDGAGYDIGSAAMQRKMLLSSSPSGLWDISFNKNTLANTPLSPSPRRASCHTTDLGSAASIFLRRKSTHNCCGGGEMREDNGGLVKLDLFEDDSMPELSPHSVSSSTSDPEHSNPCSPGRPDLSASSETTIKFMRKTQRSKSVELSDGHWTPIITTSYQGVNVVITAELPRISRRDIKFSINQGAVRVSCCRIGTSVDHSSEANEGVHVPVLSASHSWPCFPVLERFERDIPLPSSVEMDKVDVTCEDGFLTISFPSTTG